MKKIFLLFTLLTSNAIAQVQSPLPVFFGHNFEEMGTFGSLPISLFFQDTSWVGAEGNSLTARHQGLYIFRPEDGFPSWIPYITLTGNQQAFNFLFRTQRASTVPTIDPVPINIAITDSVGVTLLGYPSTTTVTANGLFYSDKATNQNGRVKSLGAATNGQLPIGSTGAIPVLAALTETAGEVSVTNGAGSITLSLPASIDLGGKTLEIPNGTADVALAAAGQIDLNETDEQLSVHSGSNGEISGEVAIPLIYTKSWSFDPDAVCDGAVDRLFLMYVGDEAPEGIIIDEWKVSFEADPTTEADLDLKYADAVIGVANAALVDVLDTTTGASSEDTDANINSGSAIPNGKVLYLEFGTAYTESNHQIIFQVWYHFLEN